MKKTNKVPMRRCAGCRQSFDKRSLMRVTVAEDGRMMFDKTQTAKGRGAYVCRSIDCIDRAVSGKGFSRSFRKKVDPAPLYGILCGEV